LRECLRVRGRMGRDVSCDSRGFILLRQTAGAAARCFDARRSAGAARRP
jgi:hypothetical protein